MEPSVLIKVEDVTLLVPTYLQREREVRGWARMFFGAAFDPPRRKLVRLLDSISFEAREGDRIAILGRNGAGKSTLLRVLNGVYAPSSGNVRVAGSCQALLNMSLGFNADATVRENIFLRGTAMGLKAVQLRNQIDAILEFAGLAHKANHRLRTLSAGQKMRLGFAITTSVQNDIILMDEWVGTGDAEFMAKATERMKSRVGGSKIVMLASHSVGLLRDVCNKGILLEEGKVVFSGDIVPALKAYHALLEKLREQAEAESMDAEATTLTSYGCVEGITMESGSIHLKGWCIDTGGAVPPGMAVEIHGVRYPATYLEHHGRPDVMAHFGLVHDRCGFRARVPVDVSSLAELGRDLRVLVGDSFELADAPLRLAPIVVSRLRE